MRRFKCTSCGYEFEVEYGTGRPTCLECGSSNVYRVDTQRKLGLGRSQDRRPGLGQRTGLGGGKGLGMRRNRKI